MLTTNGGLLLFFVVAAVQLLRLKKSGVVAHTTASAVLVAYYLLIYRLGSAGGRAGMSVGAAIGVGNLGIAPFLCFNLAPYVYPLVSSVLLLVARRKMGSTLQTGKAQ
jgi:hypothetical protein